MTAIANSDAVSALERLGLKLVAEDQRDDVRRLMFAGRESNYVLQIGESYIGAYSEAKAPLPGETWLRGNDLLDGGRSRETLDGIVAQIRLREGAIH